MIPMNVMLPEIPDEKTKEEVRKALLDLAEQFNQAMKEIEDRLAILEGVP